MTVHKILIKLLMW